MTKGKKQFNMNIPIELYEKIKINANSLGVSVGSIIETALEMYINSITGFNSKPVMEEKVDVPIEKTYRIVDLIRMYYDMQEFPDGVCDKYTLSSNSYYDGLIEFIREKSKMLDKPFDVNSDRARSNLKDETIRYREIKEKERLERIKEMLG